MHDAASAARVHGQRDNRKAITGGFRRQNAPVSCVQSPETRLARHAQHETCKRSGAGVEQSPDHSAARRKTVSLHGGGQRRNLWGGLSEVEFESAEGQTGSGKRCEPAF